MRLSLPTLTLLTLSACTSEFNQPFISGDLETSSARTTSTSGTSTTTTGLPTTTTGEGDPTGETSSSSSGEPDTGSSSSSSSSSSGEPDTGSSSGEPDDLCADGLQNQDESDIDCGGALCPACSLDAACQLDIDCASSWCEAGSCQTPGCLLDLDCEAFNAPCVAASCDLVSKTCSLAAIDEGQACEADGDLCTTGGICDQGGCVGEQPLLCDALDNFCGVGSCDAGTGVCVAVPVPGSEGLACDDGFVCTPNDTCQAGLCGVGGPGYLFFEDFSDPAPGWDLGPTWAIGPAIASEVALNGADPAEDHSPGADEQLAGVLIGGLVPAGEQPMTCLSSPEIPALDPGPLWLTFWRHLHTDYFPFVTHTVEAFDGELWHELEIGYANPGIDDPAWTFLEYDLSAHAGPALRVRICYSQTLNALPSAGWSLDDLTVGPFSCTP